VTRIGLAVRLVWKVLTSAAFARQMRSTLAEPAREAAAPAGSPERERTAASPPAAARAGGRNDAVSLLAVLQREARLVDFVQESLSDYSDEQIGAAARDVHRGCAAAIDRMFGLRPLADQPDGSPLEVPRGFDAARIRLSGNVSGPPPYRGTILHTGWTVSRCELPAFSGSPEAALVVAPIEVEVA
jgi:hypothetical protein